MKKIIFILGLALLTPFSLMAHGGGCGHGGGRGGGHHGGYHGYGHGGCHGHGYGGWGYEDPYLYPLAPRIIVGI